MVSGAAGSGAGGRTGVVGGFAGTGNDIGEGGEGGTPGGGGDVVCEFPPIGVELSPFTESTEELGLDEELARTQAGMIGDWYGVVTTQWSPPYEVSARFRTNGSYSAACEKATKACCVAFYYGTDDDADIKRYELTGIGPSGAFGTIDIAFDYGDVYDLPGWQGELHNARIDATGDRLRFDFFRSDGYGPVAFDLARVVGSD
jgi:hypothetical protein